MTNTPAGWFPDPTDRSIVRYWDGTAWTSHTAPIAPASPGPAPAPAPQQTAPYAAPPVFAGPGAPTPVRRSVGKRLALWGGGAFALLLALGTCSAVVSGVDGGAAQLKDVSAADVAAGESGPKLPADQVAFLAAVAAGQAAAEDGNELQVVEARKDRADSMCAALADGLRVENWLASVESLETSLGGDGGVLSLEIAEDVAVGTWNNALSDIGSDTLIDADSSVWSSIVELEEDDEVLFSGTFVADKKNCVSESSLLDTSGMATPDFKIAFSAVGLSSDGPLVEAEAPKKQAPAAEAPVDQDVVAEAAPAEDVPVDVAPAAPTVPDEPELTAGQLNAVDAAGSYLDYSAFSRSGLIEQLEYEGYSTKDATFGVDALDANWREQAARSAKSYLDYTSFSRSGLVEQLVYEGYTPEQAEYGVSKTGL